ncbi:putative phosphotransferase [Mycobacterium paraintracellulare]|nr:putative phosphotransferase [Mycobacterium paraintracellulare]
MIMALKNKLDADVVGEHLAAWLPTVLEASGPVKVSNVIIPSASGMSSETVLFEASWRQHGELVREGLVLRIPPQDGGLFETYDLGRELRVMSLLSAHTDAPIPRVLAHETTGDVLGSPFALLERAYGEVPGDDPPFVTAGWVVDLTAEQRATMFDEALKVIASIQRADPVALGLTELLHADLGDTVIEQELQYWQRFYSWAAGDTLSPTIDKAFELLAASRPTQDNPLVVSWGDARFGNLMFGPDQKVTGVFDWEMATLGRPEVDLGYFLFFDRVYSAGIGLPRLEGFPDRSAAITRFEQLTGRTMQDLDWFEAWAALRGAILLLRVGKQMIELGLLPPDAPMPFNNPASQVLASLLDLPAPTGAVGWITGHR